MSSDPQPGQHGNRVGEFALVIGVVAIICACLPVLSDIVALPAAVIAVTLGLVGMHRHERGRATRLAAASLGTVFGAIAFVVFAISFAATNVGA